MERKEKNCYECNSIWFISKHFYFLFIWNECFDRGEYYQMLESSLRLDYVTEKFLNVFEYWVTPIVYGSANYLSLIT